MTEMTKMTKTKRIMRMMKTRTKMMNWTMTNWRMKS
jgi:hypothetical protein